MTTSLPGAELAKALRADVEARVAAIHESGHTVRLAVVTATADESSAWYVRSIVRACGRVGIDTRIVDLGPAATADEIADALRAQSADPSVSGIILQTPLPGGITLASAAIDIDPAKDVDGANPASLGALMAGRAAFAPATAEAVVRLLEHHEIALRGREAVIVGRSLVVGKPLAHLLLDRDATVTVAHSRTRDLAAVTSRADVLVAAVGRTHLVTKEHVRPGAVVVDVGTNATADGGLRGDVDPAVGEIAALSPVPGGVGPVTTALLLQHAVEAAERAR